ncbi:hypothetical protein B0H16DRAFT_890706 [Mycena metata]|uniref:F-box domain-containing protein n=1 Tax=Mycena metata TaxID=1033252 RepID=A0AAD7IRN4_9AGAR|nr:hypothetical protein B0H16DRAFT_890706 [Mycena metata]
MLPFPMVRLRNKRFRRQGDRSIQSSNPFSLSPMMGFPFEIFMLVLEQACGTYFQTMKEFIDMRSLVMTVCAFWHDVVLEHGQFWSQYHIMPGKRYVDILDWTSHFNNRLVDLTVHLDSTPLPLLAAGSSRASNGGRLTLLETAVEAARHAGRCDRLHVTAHEVTALPTFLDGIRHSDGSDLEALSIGRIVSQDPNAVAFHTLAHPIFGSYLPRLRFIRLLAFVLSWNDLFYYPEAVYLVFHQVMESFMIPTWKQLEAVLLSAPNLRRLSLRHFACGPLVGSARAVVLPNVVELDMCFCGDNLAAFMAGCVLPSLTTYTATFSHPGDIVQLLWCKDLLANVTSFTLSGRCDRLPDIVAMFRSLPMMEHVNLSDAGPSFIEALTPGKAHNYTLLCPLLREVSLCDCPLLLIADFVWFRKVLGSPIDLLEIHDLPDYDLRVETWIGENVGYMSMDPPYDFRDAWIWHNENYSAIE